MYGAATTDALNSYSLPVASRCCQYRRSRMSANLNLLAECKELVLEFGELVRDHSRLEREFLRPCHTLLSYQGWR